MEKAWRVLIFWSCLCLVFLAHRATGDDARPAVYVQTRWEAPGAWYRACVITLNNFGESSVPHIKFGFTSPYTPTMHIGIGNISRSENHWFSYVEDWLLPLQSGQEIVCKLGFNFPNGEGDGANLPTNFFVNDHCVSIEDDHTPPSIPLNLAASHIKPYSFRLSWTPSEDNVAVVGYVVSYFPTHDTSKVITKETPETDLALTNLTPNIAYNCTVRAFDGAYNMSDFSARLDVRTAEETITPAPDTSLLAMPYVDGVAYPTPQITSLIGTAGTTGAFVGFVVHRDGKACWGGHETVYDSNTGQTENGDATTSNYLKQAFIDCPKSIISIGGAAGSPPAANSALTSSDLCAIYRGIIDNYKISGLDFDYEGGFLADTAALKRHTEAVRQLLVERPNTHIFYTLPVDGSPGLQGFNQFGEAFLSLLYGEGILPTAIQCMLMEFGQDSDDNLFNACRIALEGAHGHIKKAFGTRWRDEEIWQHMGACPMFGRNNNGKIFTLENQTDLNAFCREKGMPLMSGWDMMRDTRKSASELGVLTHEPYAFSKEVAKFALQSA